MSDGGGVTMTDQRVTAVLDRYGQTDIRPYLDRKVATAAAKVDLPAVPDELARLVAPPDLARLAAGLVRVALDRNAVKTLREHASA
jgi:hypothetical protein